MKRKTLDLGVLAKEFEPYKRSELKPLGTVW